METTALCHEPRTKKHLEEMKGVIRGTVQPPPVAKLVGFEFLSIELGRSEFALNAGPQHANPMGTLHGGIICDLADAALGTAMASTLEDDETFTSLDLAVKFLKPVWTTRLRAVAKVVKRTRSLGLIECDVTDDSESLVARVYSSCMVLRGESARGR
jgi:uncharacterized protein (TIGR00369 family)